MPGSGKGTLIRHAKELFPEFVYPVSWTTRPKRPNETEGEVYHFATSAEFDTAVKRGEFLEWVQIDEGRKYGTIRKDFEGPLTEGKVVLRELEVQGARTMRELMPNASITSIFVKAGDWEDLKRRMRERAPMSDEELAARKKRYEEEVRFADEADYVLENTFGKLEEVKHTFAELIRTIIKS